MTYEHPLAARCDDARAECLAGGAARDGSCCCSSYRLGCFVGPWTASHVLLPVLPAEVVHAIAEARRAQAAAVQFVATYAPRLAEEMQGRARRAVTAQLATRPIRCGGCEHHRVKSYGDRDPPHSECRHPSRNNRLVVVDEDHAPPRGCPLPKAPKKRDAS